jgi:hypothetical protein
MKRHTGTPEPRRRYAVPNRHAAHVRGAAYVEAILVVIFMTIIFVGVLYLGSYFDAKQRALGIARQCAWAFSKNACEYDPECGQPDHYPCLPDVCSEALGQPLENEPNTALKDSVEQSQNESQGLPSNRPPPKDDKEQKQEDLRVGVEDEMGPMMEMLVGESLNADGSGQIAVPRMIPDAQSKITVSYWLPCNLRHKDAFDVAMNLFGSLFSGGL